MVEFLLGGSGTGKSTELISKIKEACENGRKCIVIIPDQFSFEYDKKLYNALGAKMYNNLTVLSFGRLSSDIFMKFGGRKGSYASECVKLALTYIAVNNVRRNNGFMYFEKRSRSGSFAKAVMNEIKELCYAGITADDLLSASESCNGRGKSKAVDVANIFFEYERLLNERNLKDSISDVEYASEIAKDNGYFKDTDVFIDEFQTFPSDQMKMIEVIVENADNLTVCLTTDNPLSKLPLFSAVNRSYSRILKAIEDSGCKVKTTMMKIPHRFVSKDIALLSENIFRNNRGGNFSSDNIKLVFAGDIYRECEYVSAEIKNLVMGGMKYSDIAVLTRNTDSYCSIIESTFERYDIPVFMDIKKPLMHKSVMLMILSALEYASSKKVSTETVLKYIKTGLTGVSAEDAGVLDNFVYRFGVDGDLWLKEFIKENTEERETAEKMRAKVIPLLEKFKDELKNATGKEICKAIFSLMTESGAYDYLSAERSLDTESLEIIREQKQVWNMVCDILDELCVVLGDEKIPAKEFKELFLCIASGEKIANPPQTLDAVVFSGTERARLSSHKTVFVIGASDGNFPADVSDNGLFGKKDIKALSDAGIELDINSKYRVSEEIFFAYKALTSPSEKLYITHSYLDTAGTSLYPSNVMKNTADMVTGDISVSADNLGAIFFSRNKKSAYYNFVCEFEKDNTDSATLRKYLKSDSEYSGRVDFLENTVSDKKKSLSKDIAEQLFGKKLYISPSRFEDYQNCPFIYFCKKGLSLYPIEKIEFSAQSVGSAVHYCLYSILGNTDRNGFLSMTEKDFDDKVDIHFKEYLDEKMGGDYGKDAEFMLSADNIKRTIKEILCHLKEEFSQASFYPFAFEASISDDKGGFSPRTITSPDGVEVCFIGDVDRADSVEIDGEKFIRVVDYKTGDKEFAFRDVYYGKNMQMLIYLYSIAESVSDSIPAGVLYMPSHTAEAELDRNATAERRKELLEKNYKMKGVVLDNEDVIRAMEEDVGGKYIPVSVTQKGSYSKNSKIMTADEFLNMKKHIDETVGKMADNLISGKIEASPLGTKNSSPCKYCDYYSVCLKSTEIPERLYDKDADEKMKEILAGGGSN
ncbi:MAG: PD-(D/E)XK nuclease family protein [Oscillospiraceae bacterium]|nr:PD-(D/E)XK nuclease family protein [Oscillospiraceae bacterium]